MKDQRTKQSRSALLTVTAVLLMLVISVMGLTAIVSADQPTLQPKPENFVPNTELGMALDADGYYVKEYDGTSDAYLAVNPDNSTIDGVAIEVLNAWFINADEEKTANAWDAKYICVNYDAVDGMYAVEAIKLPAKIVAKDVATELNPFEVTYDPNGIKLNTTVTVDGVNVALKGDLGVLNVGEHTVKNVVTTDNANYAASEITVKVNPVVISAIEWGNVNSWTYGAACPVVPMGKAGTDLYNAFEITCAKDGWANGDAGEYTLVAKLRSSNYVLADDNMDLTYDVSIKPCKLTITANSKPVFGDGMNSFFPALTITGCDEAMLAEIMDQITYAYADGSAFNGVKFGDVEVKVALPGKNYVFTDADGATVTSLTVNLMVRYQEKLFPVYDEAGNLVGSIILVAKDENGFTDDITVDAVALKGYPKIVKTKYNQVYKVKVNGAAEGQTFSLIIPLNDSVYAPRTSDLGNALYVFEAATGKLTSAVGAGYSVALKDGYFEVGGFAGETTFAVAPDYNAPFFTTIWGILLIIVLVIGILVMMCYVGLYLRRILETRENPVTVIDTVGELPETEPVEVEEKEEVDADAVIEQNLEEMAETVEEAAEETVVDEAELQEVVDETVQEVMEEAAAVELDEETQVPEELAEEVAEEVTETAAEEVPAVEEEAVEEAVAEAVEEAVAEEPAEEAVEEVAEVAAEEAVAEEATEVAAEESEDDSSDDDSDDNDGDAEGDDDAVEAVSMVEDTTFGFGAGADIATFIDVKENPEEYQAMLDREARGEIKIVYRYKKSFQSKLAQSQGNVQDYYSELKNALLTFKGVKNRLSWNYEAFNKGRAHVAKMDAKSKTLYLYLAMDPTQFADTKYGVVDVSAKRKYASTPTLIKIKGERKFKHALELIEKLCGEQMELAKVEAENVDYRVARLTIDEMVDAGLMKKSAGYIVLDTTTEA